VIPIISLVVLSYNNWNFTYTCLTSLMKSFDDALIKRGIEVIVVDNGSDDETRQQIKEFVKTPAHPDVQLRLVLLEENLGYPSGVNVGLQHCLGSFIGVLNNDLVFPRGWLAPLIQALEDDKLIGFAAPCLSFAPSLQNVQKTFASFEDMQDFAARFTSINSDKKILTDKVIGACVLFRRDLLHSIGGNDFWYGLGNFDDDDWCLRARIAGYQIVVIGSSFVEHIGHATFRLDLPLFSSSLLTNGQKFKRKWRMPKETDLDDMNGRKELVAMTKFDRGKHYIPLHIADFSRTATPFYVRSTEGPSWFMCADWTASLSQWRETIFSLILENQQLEVCLWVPESYFDVKLVIDELQLCLSKSQIHIHSKNISFKIFQENVPHIDILRVLASTDAIIRVPGDFVNRYIVRLAKQIDMEVIYF
jgi:GT2 family glycosyltransferase